jgi:hypothetical protein
MARRSLPQSPDAFTLINTCPKHGLGTGNSRISKRRLPSSTAPLMLDMALHVLPIEAFQLKDLLKYLVNLIVLRMTTQFCQLLFNEERLSF